MDRDCEKALLVGVSIKTDNGDIDESMKELEELARAAGCEVCGKIIQSKDKINSATFIGKGKAEEIKKFCDEQDVETVIFNDELSGSQMRNLEEIIDRKIVDRTNLILDIFAQRASSSLGKLQVKLAQLNYRLPRLIGYRDYLSREGAGIGTRGPGEQKLELDRRAILDEIDRIKSKIEKEKQNRELNRKQREKSGIPVISLVGYTNAGKSTIMNRLLEYSDSEIEQKKVFVKDMLFATLDTSHRSTRLLNKNKVIFVDTVGFVSKLPTKLIEAFKGTLEELEHSDLIVHVLDASNERAVMQLKTTMDILSELNIEGIPVVTVFNKIDKLSEDFRFDTDMVENPVMISAKYDKDLDKLMAIIEENLPIKYIKTTMIFGYDAQNVYSELAGKYEMLDVSYEEEGTLVTTVLSADDRKRYSKFIKEN